ncbi:hypothetical protein OG239_26705 [Streptomyces sp. NBC_00868]|uniref:hypothetical protein n=1 Tax=unclassified Streptomyces TaxID=2593676 RepID=UPI003245B84A|nr:hypothetical protein OG239_26705 [Streptomyces sp. NBC_00868]
MLFLDRYVAVLERSGRRGPTTPFRAIEMWDDFVEDCRDGYEATLFEYWDEISIRRFLQSLLDDPVARETPEIQWFAAEVHRIDDAFRQIVQGGFNVPGERSWWESTLPRRAGEEMARNVRDLYGFEMEPSS